MSDSDESFFDTQGRSLEKVDNCDDEFFDTVENEDERLANTQKPELSLGIPESPVDEQELSTPNRSSMSSLSQSEENEPITPSEKISTQHESVKALPQSTFKPIDLPTKVQSLADIQKPLTKTEIYHLIFGITAVKKRNSREKGVIDCVKVRVLSKNKESSKLRFKDVRVLQEFAAHEGAIWTMKFSPDGKYLCTAGQDTKVIVWVVGCRSNVTSSGLEPPSPTLSHEDQSEVESGEFASSDFDISSHYSGSGGSFNEKDGGGSGGGGQSGGGGNMKWNGKGDHDAEFDRSDLDTLFIKTTPHRVFLGHASDVIDISWSKSHFILSASIDKTARLWHTSREECLHSFKHPDFVTAVDFHPIHDRFFISGCFDRRLRVWDIIPEGIIREWAQAPEIITSVCFSPDGQIVTGGLMNGQVYFYEYEGMKYVTQMDCKNRSGKYASGKKVTGLQFLRTESSSMAPSLGGLGASDPASSTMMGSPSPSMPFPPFIPAAVAQEEGERGSGGGGGGGAAAHSGDGAVARRAMPGGAGASEPPGTPTRTKNRALRRKNALQQAQLLVSTNDDRVRLFQMEDYSLHCKYKGIRNRSMQIKASFSDDGQSIICGSEDGTLCIWDKEHSPTPFLFFFSGKKARNEAYETFQCTSGEEVATTAALFAPADSLLHIVQSHPRFGDRSDRADMVRQLIADRSDLCTRAILSADYEGRLKVFVRDL